MDEVVDILVTTYNTNEKYLKKQLLNHDSAAVDRDRPADYPAGQERQEC